MTPTQLLTIVISVGIPLLAFAFAFGRFSQKTDGLKDSIDNGFKMLAEREAVQDKRLNKHDTRLTSLEEWRKITEGK